MTHHSQGGERRRMFVLLAVLLLLIAALTAGLLWWKLPRRPYTAAQLNIVELSSPVDADGDGIDDWHDIMEGARTYIATDPHYKSKYYAGGYPDDGCGVCTDVVWQAFRAAGYELKNLVDADIAAHPERYGNIETSDPNIDFRRVSNLDRFFTAHATVLTCNFDDPAQWQPGDIVTFGNSDHIAICSDKRRADGIPWIIHHGNAVEEALEADQIRRATVTGHYRWPGTP